MAPSPPDSQTRPSIMAGSSKSSSGEKGGKNKGVQWLDDQVNTLASRHHALDERGKDPKAFDSLTSALERHQSQQSLPDASNDTGTKSRPSVIHYFPASSNPNRQRPRIDTQTSSSPPAASTASSSPPTGPTSPINYNPAQRVEVPGQFIDSNERAGLPGSTDLEAFAERQAANIVRAHSSRKNFFRSFSRKGKRSKGSPSDPPVTTEGVKSRDYATPVSDVDRLTSGVDATRSFDLERDADTSSINTTSDIVPPNSGILSALLALYNTQHGDTDYDGLSSGQTSGASTPAIEDMPDRPWMDSRRGRYNNQSRRRSTLRSRSQSRETILESENEKDDDEFDEAFRKAHENAQMTVRSPRTRVASSPTPPASPRTIPVSSAPRPHSFASPPPGYQSQSPQSPLGSPLSPRISQSQSLPNDSIPRKPSIPSLSTLNPFATHRPTQARNAGGVFGTLIASTANISGAAAPINSTIAPNLARPGYHLSRYSYEDRLPTIKKERGKDSPGPQSPPESPRPGQTGLGFSHSRSLDNADIPQSSSGSQIASGSGTSESLESDHDTKQLLGQAAGGGFPAPMTAPVSAYVSPPTPDQITATPTIEKRDSQSGYFSATNGKRAKWTAKLKLNTVNPTGAGVKLPGHNRGVSQTSLFTPVTRSGRSTPTTHDSSPSKTPPGLTPTPLSDLGEWISDAWYDKGRAEKDPAWAREKKEKKELKERKERERRERKRRKKAEIYITRHVAQILQRQEFLLKLARSMMMFGAPAHRLPSQIAATARVLEIPLSCLYLPDVMIISFDDMLGSLGTSASSVGLPTDQGGNEKAPPPPLTASTSSLRLLRQTPMLDLGKLKEAYDIYWRVIHDQVSVADASGGLDELMRRKVRYGIIPSIFIGGMCAASICSLSFAGSLVDCLAVFPLSAFLVFIQSLAAKNELYSNVFEITITTLFSFVSAALASTNRICYSAVASSSVVLILPGFIVLSGALEILSRNIVSGSVRMFYAVVYCLFLGFGLAMGAEAYQKITGRSVVGLADTACVNSHGQAWWNSNVSLWWAFLTVPMFALFLTMRNQGPLFKREMLVSLIIACAGWVTNHYVGAVFVAKPIAFAVGFIANLYGRFFSGNAFVIMITGILFQVPSGLGNNGLLVFVNNQTSGSSQSYLSGFQTALQLVSVALGLTVGLGISLFLAYPIQSRKRAGGVFSL